MRLSLLASIRVRSISIILNQLNHAPTISHFLENQEDTFWAMNERERIHVLKEMHMHVRSCRYSQTCVRHIVNVPHTHQISEQSVQRYLRYGEVVRTCTRAMWSTCNTYKTHCCWSHNHKPNFSAIRPRGEKTSSLSPTALQNVNRSLFRIFFLQCLQYLSFQCIKNYGVHHCFINFLCNVLL